MGGYGSGRWGLHAKRMTVEECLALDAAELARDGLCRREPGAGVLRWTNTATGEEVASVGFLKGVAGDGLVLELSYSRTTAGGVKDSIMERVELVVARLPVGSARWYFACPSGRGSGACGRRVRKLYLPPGYRRFGCRRCHDLTYTTSQESHCYDRLFASLARETGNDPTFVKRVLSRRPSP